MFDRHAGRVSPSDGESEILHNDDHDRWPIKFSLPLVFAATMSLWLVIIVVMNEIGWPG